MATEGTCGVGPAVGSGSERARLGRAGRAAAALLGLWLALFGASSPVSAQVVDPGTVIQTIDTSLWSPPAPDAAGITYRPDTGQLLTCDSEVDEMTIFAGVNLWTHSRTGVVSSTAVTTAFSNEPTGITWDPAGGRLWISDDDQKRIYEIKFGPDGVWNTADDVRTALRGYNLANCDDLEDVAYNNLDGHLYIASSLVQEVCEVAPGPNGVFDGAATFGDDVVTTFSLVPFGILEVEGIVYDPFWNTLVLADRDTKDLYEVTPEGGYLRKIDVNFPSGSKPSGVTIAPGSTNPLLRNYWVTDRRVDNGGNPFENDGRIYEVVVIPLGGNGSPIVDAGPPQTITWPANSVSLSGFVSDDGHPYPPSLVLALWSKQSGPGSVSFGSASSASTTATFSAPGSYVLQLEGNDSLDQTVDTVAINVSQIVTLSLTSVGPGSVTVSPPGGTYTSGQTVTLTATPGLDAGFIGWSGDLTGATSPQPLLMNGNKAVTGTFATIYDVTVNSTGPGTVTLSPPGGSYPAGTVVTVLATPGANAVFNGFSGALSGTTSPQLLTVNGDKTVNASFTQYYTLSVSTTGPGSVTLSPPTGPYALGTTVTVTATPSPDAVFQGFGGDLTGATSPQPLVMNGNRSVTAGFAALYDVAVSTTGPGSVTLSPPGGSYAAGTVVTVLATPGANAVFNGFSGALTGTTSPQLLTIDADKSVGASFTQHYTLSVAPTGPGSVTLSPPSGPYAPGTTVTVTATPSPDAVFQGFGGDLTGTASPQPLVMNGNKSLTAGFAALYDVTLSSTGPGSVTLSPPGGTYAAGTVVSVLATPGASALFDGFSGALSGTTSPQLLTVDADKTINASFTQHYALSVTTSGAGSVSLSPPGGSYAAGTLVTLIAVPGANAVFSGWSGALGGSANPETLTVTANTAVSASFVQLFSVTAGAVGPGSVTLSPPTGPYPAGSVVTVTAIPAAEAAFVGWSGDLSGSANPAILIVDSDESVTGTFAPLYDVTVNTTGQGNVTLDPPGGSYVAGAVVTVTATPGANAVFDGFAGDLSGTASPQLLTVDADKTVSASFTQLYTLSVATTGPGSVTLIPPGGSYAPGTGVTLIAVPSANAVFSAWSGALGGSTNPETLIVSADASVSASFTQLYSIATAAVGPGSVTLDPPTGPYAPGTTVTVTATPSPDSVFLGWSGDLSGSVNPAALIVDSNESVTATFAWLYDVTVNATGSGSVTLDPPGGTYVAGTVVSVSATPGVNAVFDGFGGALSGPVSPQLLTVDTDKTISASFTQLYTVSASATGPGSVTLDPPTGPYAPGTVVTVTATPGPDAVFDGFAGDLSGTVSPQPLTVDADKAVTASFTQHYTVSASASGPGSVTLDPAAGPYALGTVVSVTATPGANAVFDGFAGDLSGTVSPQLLTVDADKAVSASFTQLYTVSASATGPGSVTLDPPTGPYALGTVVSVTATPGANAVFDGFAGDLSGTVSPQLLTVDADKAVTASFTQLYTVSASATGPGSVTLDPPGGTYPAGTVVTVTATPGPNAVFDGFGGDLSGTASPQLLTVDADKAVSASFTQLYTVSASASGPGSVTLDPPTGPYALGTVVSVTATPGANAVFDGFAGDLSGTVSPQLLTVDADKAVSASFTQLYTVSASATGPGSVTLDPPTGPYALGTVVSVTATPGANAVFDGFAGDLSGTVSPQLLTVDADKAVTASFTQLYTVSASATGPGSVTLDPPGGTYPAGTVVTVTATPGPNAVFDGFGGDLSGTASPQLLTVDADKAVSASFTQLYTVSASASGPGSVTLDPPTGPYALGTVVSVTATPGANAVFDGFAGDLSGTVSPQLLTVDADKAVSASFTQLYTVSASATGPGSVTLDPAAGPYALGTVVSVTATPGPNAVFDGFGGDLAGTASPQLLTVDADKAVSASFTQLYTVSASASGPGSVTLDPPTGPYALGTVVSVTATPGANAVFDGFAGDLSGTVSPQLLTVDADKAVSASFTQLYTVSVSATGSGSVTLDPPTGPYAPGTVVTVTATPGANAVFDGFAGDLAGTASPQPLTVDADKAVTASFTQHYTVSASASGPGSVTLDPAAGPYALGTVVSVTATPGPNAVFDGFAGDLSGTASPQLLTVDADKAVSASFTQLYTVSASATGPGSVTLDPPGGTYVAGTVVSVTATPGANAVFDGFGGDLAGTASPQLLTVDADKAVSASFTQLYTVSASATGPGSVTLDPPTGPYALGTVVSVTATPGANAVFDGFAGDLSGTASPQLLTVDADKAVSASFTQLYTVSASATGPGSVTLDPPTGPYALGTVVSVTAAPGTNAVFDGFAGDLSGTVSPQLLLIDADKTVTASFTLLSYTLAVTTQGGGTVTVDPPAGPYPAGSSITLTGVPTSTSWLFGGWSGDAGGSANPLLLVMDDDKAVHARFYSTGGSGTACGIGPELAAALPLLAWLHRRQRSRGLFSGSRTRKAGSAASP